MPNRGAVRAALPLLLVAITTVVLSLAISACGGNGSGGSSSSAQGTDRAAEDTTSTSAPSTSAASGTSATTVVDHEAAAGDFRNLADMTAVRGFFVHNLVGDLDGTLAVARAPDGGPYPVGSVLQLVPQEAMVKRSPGFSPATLDWEFFLLEVDAAGTVIRARGGDEVVNRFGGSCAGCHAGAEPRFDFVCEQDHGCDPLPISRSVIETIQAADPRPRVTD